MAALYMPPGFSVVTGVDKVRHYAEGLKNGYNIGKSNRPSPQVKV